MRKFVILALAAVFMVAFAVSSFAAETTFEGQYKIRSWSEWNFEKDPAHEFAKHGLYTGYFDQRFRLTITHVRSEYLKAVVQVDLVEDTWGQQRNFRMNNVHMDGADLNNGFVRKAYIEFTLPKVGTFTVGKQPVVLGYGLAFSDSSGYLDGLKWANKWGPVSVAAMYMKWDDNVTNGTLDEYYNRDADYWLLDVHITPNENHDIELFGGYANIRAGLPTFDNHWLYWYGGPGNGIDTDLGFVGIAYTGEIAKMITLKGEFSYLFGRADLSMVWGPGWSDKARLSGYNLYVDASYHNDLLRVGAAFVTGSGQTDSMMGANHFNVNMLCADEFVFGNIIASGNGGLNSAWGGGLGLDDDIENLTAAKLYFEISPTEKLSLNAAVIWARWTEHIGDTTWYNHPAEWYAAGAYGSWYGSKTQLGWEVDCGLSYKIMEGLTYSLNTGVLFTGDSWDYRIAGTHYDWGPIWLVNNELKYEF